MDSLEERNVGKSNIGDSDNTRDGGKIVSGAIGACGGIGKKGYVALKDPLVKSSEKLGEVFLSEVGKVQELGDQVKLERWQGMVRVRAARSDKDGLLGVQGEEVAFFLAPKVMTRLGVTRM
ncbi:hypothetical protein Tco_1226635 [Tanacetum coccineum]